MPQAKQFLVSPREQVEFHLRFSFSPFRARSASCDRPLDQQYFFFGNAQQGELSRPPDLGDQWSVHHGREPFSSVGVSPFLDRLFKVFFGGSYLVLQARVFRAPEDGTLSMIPVVVTHPSSLEIARFRTARFYLVRPLLVSIFAARDPLLPPLSDPRSVIKASVHGKTSRIARNFLQDDC